MGNKKNEFKRKEKVKKNRLNEFSNIRTVIPSSKYFISDRYGNSRKLRIFVHEEFVPSRYFEPNYKGLILSRKDGNYYEIIDNLKLFVKKNIRVEDYVKNALD